MQPIKKVNFTGLFVFREYTKCPECGSDDIIGNHELGYTCRDCGEEWD